jgi:hypothetical protein
MTLIEITHSEDSCTYRSPENDWELEMPPEEVASSVVQDGLLFIEHQDGMYSSHNPVVGVASQGETIEEATEMLVEATRCQLQWS